MGEKLDARWNSGGVLGALGVSSRDGTHAESEWLVDGEVTVSVVLEIAVEGCW